jgi:hypothetical protein
MRVVMRLTLLREDVRACGPANLECTENAKKKSISTQSPILMIGAVPQSGSGSSSFRKYTC